MLNRLGLFRKKPKKPEAKKTEVEGESDDSDARSNDAMSAAAPSVDRPVHYAASSSGSSSSEASSVLQPLTTPAVMAPREHAIFSRSNKINSVVIS